MIRKPEEQGQSIWLDQMSEVLVHGGELANLIRNDEVCGIMSSPVMLAKSFVANGEGKQDINDLLRGASSAAREKTAVAAVRAIAGILNPAYIGTQRREGYVSLAIDPALADDIEATLAEARRLWNEIGRENLLIALPATATGIQAISPLIADGININATMLFTPERYEQAALAYLDGLEKLAAKDRGDRRDNGNKEGRSARGDGSIASVAGVASVVLAPIDTAVDALISSHLNQCGFIKTYSMLERETLRGLMGKAAMACARVAYGRFQTIFSGPRWDALAAMGARKQRLLWESITIENPAYRETKYMQELIGADSIAAIPPDMLAVYKELRQNGGENLQENIAEAALVLGTLKKLHIPLAGIADKLQSSRLRQLGDAYAQYLTLLP